MALLDNTSAPALRKTVFLNPDSLIHSFISRIYGDLIEVASDIFNQERPWSVRYSCIGRGDPPRFIVT